MYLTGNCKNIVAAIAAVALVGSASMSARSNPYRWGKKSDEATLNITLGVGLSGDTEGMYGLGMNRDQWVGDVVYSPDAGTSGELVGLELGRYLSASFKERSNMRAMMGLGVYSESGTSDTETGWWVGGGNDKLQVRKYINGPLEDTWWTLTIPLGKF